MKVTITAEQEIDIPDHRLQECARKARETWNLDEHAAVPLADIVQAAAHLGFVKLPETFQVKDGDDLYDDDDLDTATAGKTGPVALFKLDMPRKDGGSVQEVEQIFCDRAHLIMQTYEQPTLAQDLDAGLLEDGPCADYVPGTVCCFCNQPLP